jgi:hypothetical protein
LVELGDIESTILRQSIKLLIIGVSGNDHRQEIIDAWNEHFPG